MERRVRQRSRTFLGGKIIFNSGRSAIDCTVRNMSDEGARIEVGSPMGVPKHFHLLVAGDEELRPCVVKWQSQTSVGLSFGEPTTMPMPPSPDLIPATLAALRSALDTVQVGVVILNAELRAHFINRAFRKMWQLPDSKADNQPAFVALLYHGRDTRAYKVATKDLDAYIAKRVALVRQGDEKPIDVRLASGDVVRVQCAALPDGGRVLTYTYVSDIVSNADRLEVLHTALDNLSDGIILLDSDLRASFMNRAVRRLWRVPDEQAEQRPPYEQLVGGARLSGVYAVPGGTTLEDFIDKRVARVVVGDPTPQDLQVSDGRHIRSRCSTLPDGGRMLTYTDITDLIKATEQLKLLATVDLLTGCFNRGHFLTIGESEWARYQRYLRPLTLLMLDVDHFKEINDAHGHAAGDTALSAVGAACLDGKRSSDTVGRLGGEEFGMLLPETDLHQAALVAQRLCDRIATLNIPSEGKKIKLSVSIGVAEAAPSMSGVHALMRAADAALYRAKSQGRNRVVSWSHPDLGVLDASSTSPS